MPLITYCANSVPCNCLGRLHFLNLFIYLFIYFAFPNAEQRPSLLCARAHRVRRVHAEALRSARCACAEPLKGAPHAGTLRGEQCACARCGAEV